MPKQQSCVPAERGIKTPHVLQEGQSILVRKEQIARTNPNIQLVTAPTLVNEKTNDIIDLIFNEVEESLVRQRIYFHLKTETFNTENGKTSSAATLRPKTRVSSSKWMKQKFHLRVFRFLSHDFVINCQSKIIDSIVQFCQVLYQQKRKEQKLSSSFFMKMIKFEYKLKVSSKDLEYLKKLLRIHNIFFELTQNRYNPSLWLSLQYANEFHDAIDRFFSMMQHAEYLHYHCSSYHNQEEYNCIINQIMVIIEKCQLPAVSENSSFPSSTPLSSSTSFQNNRQICYDQLQELLIKVFSEITHFQRTESENDYLTNAINQSSRIMFNSSINSYQKIERKWIEEIMHGLNHYYLPNQYIDYKEWKEQMIDLIRINILHQLDQQLVIDHGLILKKFVVDTIQYYQTIQQNQLVSKQVTKETWKSFWKNSRKNNLNNKISSSKSIILIDKIICKQLCQIIQLSYQFYSLIILTEEKKDDSYETFSFQILPCYHMILNQPILIDLLQSIINDLQRENIYDCLLAKEIWNCCLKEYSSISFPNQNQQQEELQQFQQEKEFITNLRKFQGKSQRFIEYKMIRLLQQFACQHHEYSLYYRWLQDILNPSSSIVIEDTISQNILTREVFHHFPIEDLKLLTNYYYFQIIYSSYFPTQTNHDHHPKNFVEEYLIGLGLSRYTQYYHIASLSSATSPPYHINRFVQYLLSQYHQQYSTSTLTKKDNVTANTTTAMMTTHSTRLDDDQIRESSSRYPHQEQLVRTLKSHFTSFSFFSSFLYPTIDQYILTEDITYWETIGQLSRIFRWYEQSLHIHIYFQSNSSILRIWKIWLQLPFPLHHYPILLPSSFHSQPITCLEKWYSQWQKNSFNLYHRQQLACGLLVLSQRLSHVSLFDACQYIFRPYQQRILDNEIGIEQYTQIQLQHIQSFLDLYSTQQQQVYQQPYQSLSRHKKYPLNTTTYPTLPTYITVVEHYFQGTSPKLIQYYTTCIDLITTYLQCAAYIKYEFIQDTKVRDCEVAQWAITCLTSCRHLPSFVSWIGSLGKFISYASATRNLSGYTRLLSFFSSSKMNYEQSRSIIIPWIALELTLVQEEYILQEIKDEHEETKFHSADEMYQLVMNTFTTMTTTMKENKENKHEIGYDEIVFGATGDNQQQKQPMKSKKRNTTVTAKNFAIQKIQRFIHYLMYNSPENIAAIHFQSLDGISQSPEYYIDRQEMAMIVYCATRNTTYRDNCWIGGYHQRILYHYYFD
jgi:hypothetical protein